LQCNKENPDKMNDLRGKNILITGGLGFIGSNLAHSCVSKGANVTVYDCLDPKSGGNMRNICGIEDDIEVILNDIRNFEGLCSCIRKKDIVFHCAAYTSHKNSMSEPLIDIDVNCKGTIYLLEAIRRFNKDLKLVHIGTSTQIGKMKSNPIDETHSEFPVDIYSANKSASEKYVLVYSSAYNMRTCVARLANTYGQRSNIRSPDFGFINFFIGLGLNNMTMNVFGEGKQIRNVNYVDDVVDILLSAAINEKVNGNAFFAVGNQHLTISQIAEAIVKNIGGKINYVTWPKDREPIEVGDAVISNDKLKSTLELPIFTDFNKGLCKTRDYFSSYLSNYL